MPTNFTVVKVEDMGDGSNSGAVAGGSRPISLDKVFQEEGDVSSPEPEPGKTAYLLGVKPN